MQAETDTQTAVVVTVARLIPVTVGRAAILRIIVPRTATQLNPVPYPTYSTDSDRGMTPKMRFFFRILASLELRKKKRHRAKGKRTKEKA